MGRRISSTSQSVNSRRSGAMRVVLRLRPRQCLATTTSTLEWKGRNATPRNGHVSREAGTPNQRLHLDCRLVTAYGICEGVCLVHPAAVVSVVNSWLVRHYFGEFVHFAFALVSCIVNPLCRLISTCFVRSTDVLHDMPFFYALCSLNPLVHFAYVRGHRTAPKFSINT